MTQEQEDIYAQIIKESGKRLQGLKTLSNFFGHADLFAVYIRTKVIHNLFESNKNLDIHKLELFHIQYTSSLIDLFQKLKKAKEQQYLLISDEIYINEDLIKKLESETAIINFNDEARKYAKIMSEKIQQLYTMLATEAALQFGWGDITVFSAKRRSEYYRHITAEQFLHLADMENKTTYSNEFATFEKKLLGKLNILNFRIKFACGLTHENEVVEVFDFVDSNDKFIFINGTKSFYLLDEESGRGIDLSKNLSNKSRIIADLMIKTDLLKEKQTNLKQNLPKDVEEVLAGYLEKISGVDFLDELQNVDEQTNILRAMLNININSK
jgi:NADH dehydrogenase/NADH:ubiquinone oxidoreductase subunit G